MVTILSLGFTELSGIAQERCTSPLICTEQAPHCATPHPYFVPVSPICSRITQSSGVSLAAVTSMCLPFTLSFAMIQFLLPVHHTMASRHRGHYNCGSDFTLRSFVGGAGHALQVLDATERAECLQEWPRADRPQSLSSSPACQTWWPPALLSLPHEICLDQILLED